LENRKTLALLLVPAVLLMILAGGSLLFRHSLPNVSAVETPKGIGVYWNESCSQTVYSVDWGILSPSAVKEIAVWVRNEANESFVLVLTPTNWNPLNASRYLSFSWLCQDNVVGAGGVVKVMLRLHVSPSVQGISGFSFDIVLEAREYFLGDLNKDGVVDSVDLGIFSWAFGSTPNDSRWNPNADLNNDAIIDSSDLTILAADWGKSFSGK